MRVAHRLRVLIVEDDPVFAMALSYACTKAGYVVTCAADGAEGLTIFERMPFDVVVTDLLMPKLNGQQMIRRLRAEWPCLPVVVVTGDVSVTGLQHLQGRDPGPMVLLHKPIGHTAVVNVLDHLFAAEAAA